MDGIEGQIEAIHEGGRTMPRLRRTDLGLPLDEELGLILYHDNDRQFWHACG